MTSPSYIHPNVSGNVDAHVEEVMLVAGPEECTLAGFNKSGELMVVERIPLKNAESGIEAQSLDAQFRSNALLQHKNRIRSILICDPRQLVIPEELYQDQTVGEWFRSCFFLSKADDLVVTQVSGASYCVATACPVSVVDMLKSQLAAPHVFALGAAVLHGGSTASNFARVLLADGVSYVALWKNGALLEAIAKETSDAQELAYYLFALAHKNGISQENLSVQVEDISGNGAETAALIESFVADGKLVGSYPSGQNTAARLQATFARIRSCVS